MEVVKSNKAEGKLSVNMNEDSEQVKKVLNTEKYLIHNIVVILAFHSIMIFLLVDLRESFFLNYLQWLNMGRWGP